MSHATCSRRTARSTLFALLAMCALTPLAATQTLTGFDSFEWAFTGDTFGSAGNVADSNMTVVGPDNGCSNPAGWFQTGPAAAGTLTVTVAYSSVDICHYDWPLFVLDGVGTPIAEAGSGSCYGTSGVTITREIPPGSTFGLGVGSADCGFGAGTAVFTDFSFELAPDVHALWFNEGNALDPRRLFSFGTLSATSQLGSAVAAPGDLDGDGVDDVVFGNGYDSATNKFVVEARSGASGVLLWKQTGDFSLGFALAAVSDVDGDGVRDVAASAPGASSVSMFSGTDGSELWSWNGPNGSGMGATLAVVGDLDADGIDELAVGRSFSSGPSLPVPILSGIDGSLHAELAVPAAVVSAFGQLTAPAGDVNADGTPDILVSEIQRTAFVFSGADGSALHALGTPPGFFAAGFASALHGAGDLNGDGHAEVLVGAPDVPTVDAQGELIPMAGGVALFDGDTGALLDTFFGDHSEAHFGSTLLGGFDADGDASPDMVVGVEQILGVASPDVGGISLRRLVDGETIFEFVETEPSEDAPTVYALHAPGGTASSLAVVEQTNFVANIGTLWHQLAHPGAPILNPSGAPLPGQSFTLLLRRAPAFAFTGIVLGASAVNLNFKRGVLVPAPDKILFVTLDDDGQFAAGGVWPASIPASVPVWVQAWVQDPAGPAGFSATRALRSVF